MAVTFTAADLRRLCPKARPDIVDGIAEAAPDVLQRYGITSYLNVCHFIAQAAHETDGFRTLNEYGSTAYFDKRYGPQTAVGKKLGNTEPGDGSRFHGRGIFQLTGRYNYRTIGKKLGVDLVKEPERAAEATLSLRIAAQYWRDRGVIPLADNDDLAGVTRKINGGKNGIKERGAYLAKIKSILPVLAAGVPIPPEKPHDDPAPETVAPPPPPEPDQGPAIATDAPPSLGKSSTIWAAITAAVAAGGKTLIEGVNSPYGLAALAIVVVAAAWIIRERFLKRQESGV